MIDMIAKTAQTMSAAEVSMAYATSVTKMSMDNMEELAANMIQEMLPPTPALGQYIDTYA